MTCPINAVSDFKKARGDSNNIVAMHFARADEARVDVVVETQSETLTCENLTMKNENTNLNDALKSAVQGVASAVEETMESVEQVEVLSVEQVKARYNGVRRKQFFINTLTAVVSAATITACAKKFGRSEKAAAITGGVVAGMVVASTLSTSSKADAERIANYGSEEQVATETNVHVFDDIVPAVVGSVVISSLIGRFLVRKAAEVIADAPAE